ncbi:hypothetical protein [Profundibacter sp.]
MIGKPISKIHFTVTIYALCFAVGALSHAKDFVIYGWRPYIAAPLPFEIFWSSLILFDLAVVAFLLSKHRHIGIFLALFVMLADVSINMYAAVTLNGVLVWKIVLQAIFLGFILGSVGFLYQPSKPHSRG